MGPERQSGLRPTARRGIVDAAILLGAVNPGASLTEVALRAGVGRAALHGHFHGQLVWTAWNLVAEGRVAAADAASLCVRTLLEGLGGKT